MLSKDELAARAGVHPWNLRDDLTEGDPGEISAMASAWARAGGHAQEATTMAQEASQRTADSYTVAGAAVHDPAAHVAETNRQLGLGGEEMYQVATLLDGISDHLTTSAGKANTEITTLDGELQTINNNWTTFIQQYGRGLPPEDRQAARESFINQAVQAVSTHGATIKTEVDTYEEFLATNLRSLADLGIIPPDPLDFGPGDVNLTPEQAAEDAAELVDGLNTQPPSAAGLDQIQDGSRTLDLINAKLASGEQLTASERAYLDAWYNAVGADNLAQLPDYVRDAAPFAADNRRGPDGLPTLSADEVYKQTLAPISDGIMNLSNPAKGGHATYEQMPEEIRKLVETRPGYVDVNGNRWLNEPGDRRTPQEILDGGILGVDRYNDFADLLETSTVTGGDKFTVELAESAVQFKQDLNTIQENTLRNFAYSGGPGSLSDQNFAKLDELIDDAGASDMLSVVGRNNSASADVLLDEPLREAVLGLNWEDDDGTVNVIHAGTERNPNEGGGTEKQARAALAVVQEVAGDRDAYLNRMGEDVEDSIKDVGVQYIDIFGRDSAEQSAYRGDLTDALGRPIGPAFELSTRDRDMFLQFVSGTGDDDAADFQAKATAYSQVMLADAFQNGSPAQVNETLKQAGRLDGAITQANFDYTYDTVEGEDQERAAAHRAESLRNKAITTGVGFATTLLAAGVTVGTAGTGAVLIGPAVSVTSAAVNGGLGLALTDDPAPEAQLPGTKEELFRADRASYGVRRDYLITSAAINAGVIDPGQLPPSLTQQDPQGNIVLRPPANLDDSQSKQDLSTSAHSSINAYEAAHRTPTDSGDVDQPSYDIERSNTATGTQDGDTPSGGSAWSNDERARRAAYGDDPPERSPFPERPADPRVLDDPNYDPISGQVR
ncbi:MAG: putative alpha/beta hydrolase [Pseudonocardiales bacterium]